jgi:hypothetical protein
MVAPRDQSVSAMIRTDAPKSVFNASVVDNSRSTSAHSFHAPVSPQRQPFSTSTNHIGRPTAQYGFNTVSGQDVNRNGFMSNPGKSFHIINQTTGPTSGHGFRNISAQNADTSTLMPNCGQTFCGNTGQTFGAFSSRDSAATFNAQSNFGNRNNAFRSETSFNAGPNPRMFNASSKSSYTPNFQNNSNTRKNFQPYEKQNEWSQFQFCTHVNPPTRFCPTSKRCGRNNNQNSPAFLNDFGNRLPLLKGFTKCFFHMNEQEKETFVQFLLPRIN